MDAMILGTDYARVDSNDPPNFARAKAAGIDFCYIRRFQRITSRDIPDAHYARDVDAARKAGLVVGGYIFPSFNVKASSPKSQIAAAKAAPGSVLAGVDLPPALDIEFPGELGIKATGRSKSEVVALMEQFVREIQDQFGCLPAVYTSWNQWSEMGLPLTPWISECPLWVKTAYRLKFGRPMDQVMPRDPHIGYQALDARNYHRIPDPWMYSGHAIQQFQGDATGVPGFSRTVDVNRFNSARRGDKAPHVRWMQRRLNAKVTGLALVADGDFGGKTEAALSGFQTSRGLTPTGVFDPRTFAALAW